jgi:hypothetical protein
VSKTRTVFGDDWDATDDWSGGGAKTKHLVDRGPQLGASLYELGPGNSIVYHFHHGSEESPEVAEYPDLRKITAQARTGSQTGERLWLIHDLEEAR